MMRLTLLDKLNWRPTTGSTVVKITASNQYGLTRGSYAAERIELTEIGKRIVNPKSNTDKYKALFEVFTSNVKFREFFNKWVNKSVPDDRVLIDSAKADFSFDDDTAKAFVPIFKKNCEYINLIKEVSGKNHFINIETALDNLPDSGIGGAIADEEVKEIEPQKTKIERPTLNIALHINIPPDAKPEQIEKLMESVAKYIYKIELSE